MSPWEILLRRLMAARRWPIPQEIVVRRMISLWAALRESDEITIRGLMRWPKDRPLIIDPLAEKIATAFGDLLFGNDPAFTAGDPADQERVDAMTESWAGELPAAEETCASEGEVWWRLSTNPAIPHPILTWHSRQDVVPLLHGRAVLACAFVSRLHAQGTDSRVVWRHIELHSPGVVINCLFRGRDDVLGDRQDLTRHQDTADLAETWQHDIPGMLAGRIVNRWGRRPLMGVSIYNGVWSQFLTLNEATTIGRENMRLTAKKRAVVPASAIRSSQLAPGAARPDGSIGSIDRGDGVRIPIPAGPANAWDAGEDLLVHDPLDADEGGTGGGPFKVLEYSFDAAALIAYKQDLVETICMRCDLVPQFIGSGDFGAGNSGIALRVRLLPTVNAAESRGRPWDTETPVIAMRAQLLEAQSVALGGLGNSAWVNPGAAPAVERTTSLPDDPTEIATRHATLKTADLLSIEQSVRERHADWDPEQITTEVDRIRADVQATMPAAPSFGGTGA